MALPVQKLIPVDSKILPVQNVDALRLVSANKAKTVIIMDPDDGSQGQVCMKFNTLCRSHATAGMLFSFETACSRVHGPMHTSHTSFVHHWLTCIWDHAVINMHNGAARHADCNKRR